MNGDQQMEVHYINTGFPYTVTESFMDFFEGITHAPMHYAHGGLLPDQETAYWAMNMSSYKFGSPSQGSTSYCGPYEVNDHLPRMDISRSAWEYPSMMSIEEPISTDMQSGGNAVQSMHVIPEECTPDYHHDAGSSQVILQDDVDPDSMTYEELLDLGEAVGVQSRGLSQELINLLPTARHKSGGFFSRRSGERCVICLARYKRGDWQITLPCKHAYHNDCGTKWLSINKACPVCNTEVFGGETNHQTMKR